jgi:hypothetical protein
MRVVGVDEQEWRRSFVILFLLKCLYKFDDSSFHTFPLLLIDVRENNPFFIHE